MVTDYQADEAVQAARDAVVRERHELFRAAQAAVGATPVEYDALSERTKRIRHEQLDPLADAALTAAAPLIAARVRTQALNDAADALERARDADRKARTDEQNDGDGPTEDACDAPHWECHASAAYFAYDDSARRVRAAAGGTEPSGLRRCPLCLRPLPHTPPEGRACAAAAAAGGTDA